MSKITKQEVENFLNDFFSKLKVYDIFFKNREKNENALLKLEITATQRLEYIKSISPKNYIGGPSEDKYDPDSPPNWEFGLKIKNEYVYVKINLGKPKKRVMCISFHIAENKMIFPFK